MRAIDPSKYAAWSQGDVASPNTRIPTIAAADVSGVHMSEWMHESIECSGSGSEPYGTWLARLHRRPDQATVVVHRHATVAAISRR